jgi:S-adenosylmethionine synthetase
MDSIPKKGMSVRASATRGFIFTSESVSEGHPDKVCDLIADSILDAHLAGDRNARVACEVLCKGGDVVLAGEITSAATVEAATITRDVIRRIGYTDRDEPFNADLVSIRELITLQAGEISNAVQGAAGLSEGAGDQGLMFGYATDETPERMPLPILLAHRLSALLAKDRHEARVACLLPDAKTQVSVKYIDGSPVQVETAPGQGSGAVPRRADERDGRDGAVSAPWAPGPRGLRGLVVGLWGARAETPHCTETRIE